MSCQHPKTKDIKRQIQVNEGRLMQRTVWSFIRVAKIAVMMDVDVYFRTCQITKFYDFPTKSDIGILFCIHNIFRDNFQPEFRLVLPTESGKCINVFVQLSDNPQALSFYIIYRLILATAVPCTPIGRLRAQYSVSQMRLSTPGNRKRLDTEQLRQFIGTIVVGYHTEIAVTIGENHHILFSDDLHIIPTTQSPSASPRY